MGIGGGNFMLVYQKQSNTSFAIDSRETAPMGSNENMFVNKPGASLTGKWIIKRVKFIFCVNK